MKFAYATKCNNDSICKPSKSFIILQKLIGTEDQLFLSKTSVIQTKTLILPNEFHMALTVKVEINETIWKTLPSHKKNKLWLKLKKKLYWSCETTYNPQSLCIIQQPMASSSLILRLSNASSISNHQAYIQCTICFLNDATTDLILFHRVSNNLETLSLNLDQYLPRKTTNQRYPVLINVSRIDILPTIDDMEKIFITNITISNTPISIHNPNRVCKFICGWGPQCLERLSNICNQEINCANGEDEDSRLCSAINKGLLTLEADVPSSHIVTFDYTGLERRVDSIFTNYLVVMICVVVLLLLLVGFVFFICRSHDLSNYLLKKSYGEKLTTVVQDSSTTCSTCEMKSRIYERNKSRLGGTTIQFDGASFKNNQGNSSAAGSEISYSKLLNYGRHKPPERKECHQGANYAQNMEAVKATDWLNLFIHVSCEARQKSMIKKPPPNMSKIDSRSRDSSYNLSPTQSTCVFPVMI